MGTQVLLLPAPKPATPPAVVAKSKPLEILTFLPELTPYADPLAQDATVLTDDDTKTLPINVKAFSKELKEGFLIAFKSSGGMFLDSCTKIGQPMSTVVRHLGYDPVWTAHLRRVKLSLGESVMSSSYKRALEPSGVIDRMFQLQKRFFPSAYGDKGSTVVVGVSVAVSSDGR